MAAMVNMNNLLNGKDSRWLQLEVCREFQRNKCSRQDTECKFAHPPANVEVQNGKVTACYDSIKVGFFVYHWKDIWSIFFNEYSLTFFTLCFECMRNCFFALMISFYLFKRIATFYTRVITITLVSFPLEASSWYFHILSFSLGDGSFSGEGFLANNLFIRTRLQTILLYAIFNLKIKQYQSLERTTTKLLKIHIPEL